MRTVLSWLKEFVPLEMSVQDLATTFNNLGLIVEGIEEHGKGLENVVVSKVLDIKAIKGADKIRLITVDDGDDTVEVICGAWNFKEGDFVPFAKVGAELPNGMKIGARKMKGVMSNGMLCSTTELGLGSDSLGLMILDESYRLGQPIAEALNITNETIFDLEIETNRPDALSMVGIARDLSASLKLPFEFSYFETKSLPSSGVQVSIESPELCDRFFALEVPSISVGESSEIVKRRLTLAGMRPLNNLVDASNYVMIETGQPTHPYDAEKLSNRAFIVRKARAGEKLTTLDGLIREIGNNVVGISDVTGDCVICDGNSDPIGIGGIMGGRSTEIDANTTALILEAAHFDSMSIARTSKRVQLRTEASLRFERGVDPQGIENALNSYISILFDNNFDSAKASLAKEITKEVTPIRIRLRDDRVKNILGTEIGHIETKKILDSLGFKIEKDLESGFDLSVPTFRPDIEREIDVIEEVVRIYGYERVKPRKLNSPKVGKLTDYQLKRRKLKELLVLQGLNETWTHTLLAPNFQKKLNIIGDEILVSRPLSRDESSLRMSLLPGLLGAVSKDIEHNIFDVNLFEVGHVFSKNSTLEDSYEEYEKLGIVLSGRNDTLSGLVYLFGELSRYLGIGDFEFVDSVETREIQDPKKPQKNRIKSDESLIFQSGSLRSKHSQEADDALKLFDLSKRSLIVRGESVIGIVGEVKQNNAFKFIKTPIYFLEVDLVAFLSCQSQDSRVSAISKYPSAEFDLSLTVPHNLHAIKLRNLVAAACGDLLEDVYLFDEFKTDSLRSLSFRIRVRSYDHTLLDSEIFDTREKILQSIKSVDAHLKV